MVNPKGIESSYRRRMKKSSNQLFVWRKKIELHVSQGLPIEEFSVKAEKKRQRERMAEIQKLKKRREERAIEKAQHEEKMGLLARERAAAEFHHWEKKEQEFQLFQSKLKSQIRLREGRMNPIDMLTKYLDDPYDDLDISNVFEGLTVKEMEQLHDDIEMYLDLDRETPAHIQYWEALLVVCDWELTESRKKDALEDRGLHPSVEPDVKDLLQGKNYGELAKFQTYIESEMRSGTAKVVEYWEAVLKRLHIFKAKACLKEFHAQLEKRSNDKDTNQDDIHEEGKGVHDLSPEEPIEVAGSFSPQLLHDDDDNEEAIDPEEDLSMLVKKRITVLEDRRRNQEMASPTISQDTVFGFNDEVNVAAESELYWWHDRYRPRKPMYFNHVRTGFEWNKYNRTHYDHDNPPPKTVQGYKFTIFYPDLVDKSRAPSYVIEKDDGRSETCIIRFRAGPPYEDIAFRIVNKDWDYSAKKGFKCTFERGVLHLYFNCKRYSYRR